MFKRHRDVCTLVTPPRRCVLRYENSFLNPEGPEENMFLPTPHARIPYGVSLSVEGLIYPGFNSINQSALIIHNVHSKGWFAAFQEFEFISEILLSEFMCVWMYLIVHFSVLYTEAAVWFEESCGNTWYL